MANFTPQDWIAIDARIAEALANQEVRIAQEIKKSTSEVGQALQQQITAVDQRITDAGNKLTTEMDRADKKFESVAGANIQSIQNTLGQLTTLSR